MKFKTPNSEISIQKMRRMTKTELTQEIFRRHPLEIKFVGGVPYAAYFTKSVLMDILNYTILSRPGFTGERKNYVY